MEDAAITTALVCQYKLNTSRFCAADDAAGIIGARFNLALDGRRYEPCFRADAR